MVLNPQDLSPTLLPSSDSLASEPLSQRGWVRLGSEGEGNGWTTPVKPGRLGTQRGPLDCLSRSPRRPAPLLLQDADAPPLHWQLLLQAPAVALGSARPRPCALKPCCSLLVNNRGRGGRERGTSHLDRTDVNTASRPPSSRVPRPCSFLFRRPSPGSHLRFQV